MNAIVKSIIAGSPAAMTIIKPGDVLRKINSTVINDVLDYEFFSYDSYLLLEFVSPGGKVKLIRVQKPEGMDLGIEFDTYLMDKERSCANKCIFCFIDQLPGGMRESLYYKDDDVRLSFLQGNYVTLTNLSQNDIERIINQRISPVNVSLHTLDPDLRSYMLGRKSPKETDRGIKAFHTLTKAGITLNCQIVCCPGINDGWVLSKTIEGLLASGTCINSVSIVPVGLTKHRQGLPELQPFDKHLALQTVRQVEHYGKKCLKTRGSRVFYCADELYMMAQLDLPDNDFYEDYPQLENGVGMMRLFITEFEKELHMQSRADTSLFGTTRGRHYCRVNMSSRSRERARFQKEKYPLCSAAHSIKPAVYSIVTGTLARQYLTKLSKIITARYDTIVCNVYAVRNEFFGESVTVSGLVTGSDIIAQLREKVQGSKVLIPQNMLRSGEETFLDDITVTELSNTLGVPVRIVKQDGADLVHAFLDFTDH